MSDMAHTIGKSRHFQEWFDEGVAAGFVHESRRRRHHLVKVDAAVWHMTHPLWCDVGDCEFDKAAMEWTEPPAELGEYTWRDVNGELKATDG